MLYHTGAKKKKGGDMVVEVDGVHDDGEGGHYFTIVMPDGKEKQTVAARLSTLPSNGANLNSDDYSGHWENSERLGPWNETKEESPSPSPSPPSQRKNPSNQKVPTNIELNNGSPVSLGSTTFATARVEAAATGTKSISVSFPPGGTRPSGESRTAPASKMPAVSDSDNDGGSHRNATRRSTLRKTPSRVSRNRTPSYR